MKKLHRILLLSLNLSIFILLFFLLPQSAQAQYSKLQGYAGKGGQAVTISSITTSQKYQQTFPSCTVTVFLAGSSTKPTIYSNSTGTVKANPFTAGTDASWSFYVANGTHVDIQFSGSGISTFTLGDMIAASSSITGIINVKTDFGAKGDTRIANTGSMTALSNLLTCSTCSFTQSDVNKLIDVNTSGASAVDIDGATANNNQVGTITSVISSTQCRTSFNAITSTSNSQVVIGSNDLTAISNAISAASSSKSQLYFPDGNYAISTPITALSNMTVNGSGSAIITQINQTRNGSTQREIFSIPDGTQNLVIQNLTLRGTNINALETTSSGGYGHGVKIGTGSTADIINITLQNLDISYIWGMGVRSDGDTDQTPGQPASVINVKIINCNIYNNGDNGINVNNGGGLLIAFCYLSANGAGGCEFAGSKLTFVNNLVAANRQGGLAAGGLGNPSIGQDVIISGNLFEANGTIVGRSGSGIVAGGNVVHALISNNILRNNQFTGIQLSDGTPDFASLSRDIRVLGNQIVSNGRTDYGGATYGIYIGIPGTVVEGNAIFDDAQSGYAQNIGIAVFDGAENVSVLRNHVFSNTIRDYSFASVKSLFIDEYASTSSVNIDTNIATGTVDTSGTSVTYVSGTLFSTNWTGLPIRINSVTYTISAVAANATGTFTQSGLTVTRSSGPSFSSAWIGKYIQLGPSLFFPIAAVGGANTLTITNPIGNTVPTSGNWTLQGSLGLTLATSAGVQSGVAYAVDGNVIYPTIQGSTITASTSFIPPTSTGTAIFGIDASGGSVLTIANNGTSQPFGNASNFSGLIIINDPTITGCTAMFIASNFGVTLVSAQSSGCASATATTAGKTNVYYNGSNIVEIENKTGGSVNYRIFAIRMRTSP